MSVGESPDLAMVKETPLESKVGSPPPVTFQESAYELLVKSQASDVASAGSAGHPAVDGQSQDLGYGKDSWHTLLGWIASTVRLCLHSCIDEGSHQRIHG